ARDTPVARYTWILWTQTVQDMDQNSSYIITGHRTPPLKSVKFGTTGSNGRALPAQKPSAASDTLVNVSWRPGTVIWPFRPRPSVRTAADRVRNRACPSRSRQGPP